MELNFNRMGSEEYADSFVEIWQQYNNTYAKLPTDDREDYAKDSYTFIAWVFMTLLRQGWRPSRIGVDGRLLEYLDRIFPVGSRAEETLPIGWYPEEDLRLAVMVGWSESSNRVRHEESSYTDAGVANVATKLLRIGEGESLADLCCGVGSFMVKAQKYASPGTFFGVENNYDALMVAMMRACAIDRPASLELGNAFERRGVYDKVFVDAPWGIPLRDERQLHADGMSTLVRTGATKRVTSEWLFALKALGCLAEGGRAVLTMPAGALTGPASSELRRNLVESGYVEAVVSLPKGAMPGTILPCNLLVLGHSDGAVTFVDASDLGPGWGKVTLEGDLADEVLKRACNPNDQHATTASYDQIAAEGWSLIPTRYIDRIELEDVVKLESLVTSITRGVGQIKREERVVEGKTPYRYLEARSIDEDGNLTRMAYLDSIKEREQKYRLQDGDVVMAKASPFKVAVASISSGQEVLCSGNFYIIRPDKDKVDPIYLRLFLESELGALQLRRVSTGGVVSTVTVSDLKQLQVPIVSIEEQHEIADAYRGLMSEVSLYRKRISKAYERIARLFPMGGVA